MTYTQTQYYQNYKQAQKKLFMNNYYEKCGYLILKSLKLLKQRDGQLTTQNIQNTMYESQEEKFQDMEHKYFDSLRKVQQLQKICKGEKIEEEAEQKCESNSIISQTSSYRKTEEASQEMKTERGPQLSEDDTKIKALKEQRDHQLDKVMQNIFKRKTLQEYNEKLEKEKDSMMKQLYIQNEKLQYSIEYVEKNKQDQKKNYEAAIESLQTKINLLKQGRSEKAESEEEDEQNKKTMEENNLLKVQNKSFKKNYIAIREQFQQILRKGIFLSASNKILKKENFHLKATLRQLRQSMAVGRNL